MSLDIPSVLKNFDDLVRCSSVLTEGIESEFIKFVKHQEECRKKWLAAEQENVIMKQQLAKLKAEKDACDVKLKHARNQLEGEMKKRMKAEATVDHLERQLSLIKELLNDRESGNSLTNAEKQTLERISKVTESQLNLHRESLLNDRLRQVSKYIVAGNQCIDDFSKASDKMPRYALSCLLCNLSCTMDESGSLLSSSVYDETGELLDETLEQEKRRSVKRGIGEVQDLIGTETTGQGKRKKSKMSNELHKTVRRSVRLTVSPVKKTERLDREFSRPPPQRNRRLPTRQHIKRCASLSDLSDVDKETSDSQAPKTPPPQKKQLGAREMTRQQTVPNLYPALSPYPNMTPKQKFATLNTPRSARSKFHTFCTKTLIKPETCGPCGKHIGFCKTVLKCRDCKAVCHPECKAKVPLPCVPSKETPGRRKEGTIESYAPKYGPAIPRLVVSCISEVEKRGLQEQGIYRVPGAEKEVKELRDKFFRGKDPDLTKISDIHTICSTLKDFFKSLTEPIITFALYEGFRVSATMKDDEDSLAAMYQCVSELPPANRDTLAKMMLHLQKVANAPDCKMNIDNLSKVFGPTLVGHRSPNPSHLEMFEDLKFQPKVVHRLISMPTDYWNQFVSSTHLSQVSPPYNPTTHYSDGTPKTPDCRPVPESMLGPIDPIDETSSPVKKKGSFLSRTPLTPKFGNRNKDPPRRHYFDSPQY